MNGKEKIETILMELKMKAPTFANSIGVPYQRIFDIQRGKTKKISGDLASAISFKYPQYHYDWLLSREVDSIKIGRIGDVTGAAGQVSGGVHIGKSDADLALIDENAKLREEVELLRENNRKLLDQVIKLTDRLFESTK